jgi:hypothetical protein
LATQKVLPVEEHHQCSNVLHTQTILPHATFPRIKKNAHKNPIFSQLKESSADHLLKAHFKKQSQGMLQCLEGSYIAACSSDKNSFAGHSNFTHKVIS